MDVGVLWIAVAWNSGFGCLLLTCSWLWIAVLLECV